MPPSVPASPSWLPTRRRWRGAALACIFLTCCRSEGGTPAQPAKPDASTAAPAARASGLKISAVRLFGRGGERPEALFGRGEEVEIRALIAGFRQKERRIHLKATLLLTGPGNRVIAERRDFTAVEQAVPAGKSTRLLETAVGCHWRPPARRGPTRRP